MPTVSSGVSAQQVVCRDHTKQACIEHHGDIDVVCSVGECSTNADIANISYFGFGFNSVYKETELPKSDGVPCH